MPDPYRAGMLLSNPYAKKVPVAGKLVVILDGELEGRELKLIDPMSRALCQGEIHELILTDEEGAGPGQEVNRIGYLGFLEILAGGVVIVGDEVLIGGAKVGEIAGFDDTHMPNHWNVIVSSSSRQNGHSRGLELGETVAIIPKRNQ